MHCIELRTSHAQSSAESGHTDKRGHKIRDCLLAFHCVCCTHMKDTGPTLVGGAVQVNSCSLTDSSLRLNTADWREGERGGQGTRREWGGKKRVDL